MGAVDDVQAYLEAHALAGSGTGWDVLRRAQLDPKQGTQLPIGDQLVVLTEDGGQPPEIPSADGIGDSAEADVGVQVLVRGGAYDSDATRDKAEAIRSALHGLLGGAVGATTYLRVRALTPEPVFLGFDDRGRPRHSVSLRLLRAA
jgi:hypothetical protein